MKTTKAPLPTGVLRTAIVAVLLFAIEAQAAEPDVISVGIVPQQNASRLALIWRPILSHLETSTGLKLQFKTAPSIPVFEERVAAGRYEIVYMNPYHYVEFSRSAGYRAFAKAKNKSIRGIIVVHKDSDIERLNEFDQQTLAFPAPAAFAATVLPGAQFAKDGIEVTPKYVSSHDSVYMAVARGIFVGGGGVQRTLNHVSPEVRNQLRVLWTSQPYTSHPLAAHPRLGAEVTKQISFALTEMEESEKGRSLLKQLGWNGVEIANDKQWDDVRNLNLEPLTE